MDHAELSHEDGHLAKWHQLWHSSELWVIDATTGVLQRLRKHVEPGSADADDSADDRRRNRTREAPVGLSEVAAPSRPGRLRSFLTLLLVLTIGVASGAAFSYHLLSKSVASNGVVIDYLRDEIAELQKQDSINLKERAKHQRIIFDYEKQIAAYREEIDDYTSVTADLRAQLNELKNARIEPSLRDVRHSQALRSNNTAAAPEKTGTCNMGTANAAANLSDCVKEFNRR